MKTASSEYCLNGSGVLNLEKPMERRLTPVLGKIGFAGEDLEL